MRSFGSDNNSGVHPLIFKALEEANVDHAIGYGDDKWTEAAAAKIKEAFGPSADPYFLFNGTGANSVAIQSVTRPFNSIICATSAHIYVDECGAPQKMSGCSVVAIPTADGKLSAELIKPHLNNFGVCHHSQPGVVYISQTTELGTVYTIEEIRSIADLIHAHGMYLHMDGARLANAAAYLGCSFKEMTVDAGVDVLSFGGTKNGMMMGESVISFKEEISVNMQYYRKQSAQLASKLRYLSAQFIPYLENNLWLENAQKANAAAAKLYEALKKYEAVEFTQEAQTNQLFLKMPKEAIEKLLEDYFFYIWNEHTCEVRFVTSWDTTEKDIADLIASFEKVLSE
ncbi:MAG: beta-eliminating lyase-related protein [Rikenellaceae bacterium]